MSIAYLSVPYRNFNKFKGIVSIYFEITCGNSNVVAGGNVSVTYETTYNTYGLTKEEYKAILEEQFRQFDGDNLKMKYGGAWLRGML